MKTARSISCPPLRTLASALSLAFALAFALASSGAVAGCTWETELPDDATSTPIAPAKELVVTDDAVLDALSRGGGPLGFPHASAKLRLADGALLRWLDAWTRRLADEGHPERATAFSRAVTCPWLRATPANACDATCSACAARSLDPLRAPLRLVAVANRTDLSVMPDRAADGGEGRLVFAVTDGPADDAGSAPLAMTVILEYAQEGAAIDWARRWHALGARTDPEFPAALAALTAAFVEAGSIAQIRTADATTGPMVLHEFHVEGGEIVPTNVRNAPDWSRVPEASLRSFADANADAIADGTVLLPKEWWARASSPDDATPPWVPEPLAREACGGCHALSDTRFQIDPRARGAAKLSRFFAETETARRVEWMQLELWKNR